jgi:aminopeptidase N
VPSVNAKAFQVAFEKTLAKSARLSTNDVAVLEKKARALKDPSEKEAAAAVLALVRHDRILDENEVEPARAALCKLLGVSPSRLPAALERVLTNAVPVPNVRVADYDLSFDFSVDAPSFPAKAGITFEKATTSSKVILEIDPDRVDVAEVRAGNKKLAFTARDGRLFVSAPVGTKKITIDYTVKPTDDTSGYGLIRDRHAGRMWTLTWPYNTGALFPSSSRPDDGATARVTVHVKAGDKAIGPGAKNADGAHTLRSDVPAYAVAFTTGKLTDMSVSERGGYKARTVGLGSKMSPELRREVRENTAEALHFLSSWLGPYPHGDTLNIVEIKSDYGGMEHAGAIAIGVGQTKADTIEAAVHETAHHWFGDGVHIAHWGELWMSEGFTNFATFRFFEKTMGVKEYQRLLDHAKDTLTGQLDGTDGKHKGGQPLSNHDHVDPQEGLSWVPYMHGVWMLRMLEVKLGRAVLDPLVRDWYQAKKGQSVTTNDFIEFARARGHELGPFFKEWMKLDHVPTFKDASRIDGKSVTLSLKPKEPTHPSVEVPVVIEGHRGQSKRVLVTPGTPIKLDDVGFNIKKLTWDPDRTVLVDVK